MDTRLLITVVAAVGASSCRGSLAPIESDCGAGLVLCSTGCDQETQATCVNGAWQCPPGLALETPQTCPARSHLCDGLAASLPLACSCDPATGALSCDAGTDGAPCPAVPQLRLAGGALFSCVRAGCDSDAGVRPICANGGLTCPPGSVQAAPACSTTDAGTSMNAGPSKDASSPKDARPLKDGGG